MNNEKHVQQEWDKYLSQVYGAINSEKTIMHLRRAFFAGATAMFSKMLNVTEDDEEKDVKMLEDIYNEVQEFGQNVMNGKA